MAGGAGDRQHAATVVEFAPGTVDDDVVTLSLQHCQIVIAAAVTAEVLHILRDGVCSAGEQGELMALGLQTRHQGLAHKTGSAHHQNLHESSLENDLRRCSDSRARLAHRLPTRTMH